MPNGREPSRLVPLAPYLTWLTLAVAVSAAGLWNRELRFSVGAFMFVWLFALPLADIAFALSGYLMGGRNDLFTAFGAVSGAAVAAAIGLVVVAFVWGFVVHGWFYARSAPSSDCVQYPLRVLADCARRCWEPAVSALARLRLTRNCI